MNDKAYVILAKFPGLNPEIQIWRGMIEAYQRRNSITLGTIFE